MKLFGREWTRRELEARCGRIEQLFGLRRLELSEGNEAGVGQLEVRTGGGLVFMVTPEKGMDISGARMFDSSLAWQSPAGDVNPAYYDPRELEWLRTASGGLLMTCGLSHAGAPCQDEGTALGLHGRAHHSPARQVGLSADWVGDEYEMSVRGVIEETSTFGPKLRLTRNITARAGCNALKLTDVVENVGFETSPLMMVYHFNFGFPLIDESTTVDIPSDTVQAAAAEVPLEGYNHWQAPEPGFAERVYYHTDLQDTDGRATAVIHSPRFCGHGADVSLKWKTETLPMMVQWKMPGAGEHVLGLEPSNCRVAGRAAERERGSLQRLAPGERRVFELDLSVEMT